MPSARARASRASSPSVRPLWRTSRVQTCQRSPSTGSSDRERPWVSRSWVTVSRAGCSRRVASNQPLDCCSQSSGPGSSVAMTSGTSAEVSCARRIGPSQRARGWRSPVSSRRWGFCNVASQLADPPADASRSSSRGQASTARGSRNRNAPSTDRDGPSGRSATISPSNAGSLVRSAGSCNQVCMARGEAVSTPTPLPSWARCC